MPTNKPIKKLFISDIHYGKDKNKQQTETIDRFFLDHMPTYIDYLILSGDVYDKQIPLGSDAAIESMEGLIKMAKFCVLHDITFIILEGTPSHDRKQIRMFSKVVEELLPDLDYHYITDLCVRTFKDNHTMLFIPDEIRPTTQQTYLDVVSLLQEHNVETVDSCVMHGAFKHSLAIAPEEHLHNEEELLNLVEGFIVSGHIHKFQCFNRIITPGSFERLQHNEEEAKGGVLTIEFVKEPHKNEFRFLENEHAKIFKTIHIETETMDEMFLQLNDYILSTPHGSNFALKFEANNPLFQHKSFIQNYPDHNITFVKKDEDNILLSETTTEDQEHWVGFEPHLIEPFKLYHTVASRLEGKIEDKALLETINNYIDKL